MWYDKKKKEKYDDPVLLSHLLHLPEGQSLADRTGNPVCRTAHCRGKSDLSGTPGLVRPQRSGSEKVLQHQRPALSGTWSEGQTGHHEPDGTAAAAGLRRDAGEASDPGGRWDDFGGFPGKRLGKAGEIIPPDTLLACPERLFCIIFA